MPWTDHAPDPYYGTPAWKKLRERVRTRAGGRCERCGGRARLSVDHVVPRSQGGSDEPSNLMALCNTCHNRKTATEGGGFRQRKAASDPECLPRTQW